MHVCVCVCVCVNQVAAKVTQDILGAATEEDDAAGGIKIQSYHR
jgi:hypothetical protein